jgi:beta-phosphoglucomutase-like phosphatase (HAD superfamily)
MQVTLGITGLLPKFNGRMVSATEVAHGKPAPDLFLYAAEKCGADPKKCAVVEDSMPGVEAAVAAGMAPFAYVHSSSPEMTAPFKQNGAVVFTAMNRLPVLLKNADNDLK